MPDFSTFIAAYREGRLQEALTLAESLVLHEGERQGQLLLIVPVIRLKLGDKAGAARDFLKAARGPVDDPGQCMTMAVKLFGELRDDVTLADLAAEAMAMRPQDANLAFTLAQALERRGDLHRAESFIGVLDCQNRDHLALLTAFSRNFSAQPGYYQVLKANLARYPDNFFLWAALVGMAQERCDFAVLDAYQARLSQPDAADLLPGFELGLVRLARTDDEAEAARPNFHTRELEGRRKSGGLVLPRRAFGMGERIQLAYFSGDLNGHAVAQLIQETLVRHDRQRFEVTILSYSGPHATRFQARWPDWLQKEVVHVDDWSSARTIDYIREQQIDILVDLQGYTGRARLDVVDACDAPVKVTYLGYPGSVMGAGLDYAITDKVVTPDSSKAFYAEKLCRLPETYQVNGTMHRRRMAALPRPALGLPEDCFVYACFNATRKIGRAEVSLWSRILHAVPGSVLAISCVKPDTRANLLAAFGEKGIGPDRLILFDYCAYDMFTARMMVSDLALDTFIYNGHTTTADALYAGLPVLTKKGSAFAGRVSESLLKAVSLPEMVAEDGEDFVARAVALARDPAALQTIRATLAERVVIDPLFDSERFTLHLETAYAMMAERARAGLPPEHFDVPARPPRTRPFLSFNEVAA